MMSEEAEKKVAAPAEAKSPQEKRQASLDKLVDALVAAHPLLTREEALEALLEAGA